MMPLDPLTGSLTLLSAWVLGLSTGLTLCALSCMPTIGSWVLARSGGGGQALGDTLLFLSGRVTGYAMLAGVAAGVGQALMQWREHIPAEAILASALIIAGAMLLKPQRGCPKSRCQTEARWPTFLIGLGMSLVPCPPLAALLSASANVSTIFQGALLGGAFGVGAAISPVLIVAPLFGLFGKSMVTAQPWLAHWIRRTGGVVLILLGLFKVI
uniref:Putative Cytochrome c biogenesis protein, transmembrane region, DsbD n=1 Tax=Magnetococcus massalia (strain MO-1) TaxID=451514 RepID=A0A1S7LD59_MAGMO|nr:Putative Cytochrome c biogenesis protein, transmembrane region, DsbD [Candidatus Magnetococcus massalia]